MRGSMFVDDPFSTQFNAAVGSCPVKWLKFGAAILTPHAI